MINWDVRYAAAVSRLPELTDPAACILEVGSGGGGLRRYVNRPIIGIELDFRLAIAVRPWGIVARAGHLPFADGSFDAVLAMDVIEHLSLTERRSAITEMARVSRGRVVIGGPLGSFAAWGDARYAEHLRQRGQPIPAWLAEHLHLGIPAIADLLTLLDEHNLDYRLHANETLIQHYAGVLADELPFLSQINATFRHKRPDRPPLGRDERDVPYSYLVEILGRTRAKPSVEPPLVPYGDGSLSLFMLEQAGLPPLSSHTPTKASATNEPSSYPTRGGLALLNHLWQQNRREEFVGLCPPGKLFDFLAKPGGPRQIRLNSTSEFLRHQPAMTAIDQHGEALRRGSVLIAAPDTVQPNVAEHYMHDHFAHLYLAAINRLLHEQPVYRPFIREQFTSGQLYGDLMFISHATVLDELCHWLFPLLEELTSKSGANPNAASETEAIAERLASLFFRRKSAAGTKLIGIPIFCFSEDLFLLTT